MKIKGIKTMKTLFRPGRVAGVLTATILAVSQFAARGAEQSDAGSIQKNSFKAVTSQLDPGGNLYAYLSTEQWLDGLSGKVSGIRDWFKDLPMNRDEREHVNKVIDVLASLIQHCGIEDISGVGMSSIVKEKGLYRSRFVVHHYPGKGSGFLWTMFGEKPHGLPGMELLPATTAIASFSDFDLGLLWSAIQKEVDNAGIPEVSDALKQVPDGFEGATGLKLSEVLASLGNEFGLVITLDDAKKISIPLGGDKSMDVPEPGILLAIKVKNDLIFNRVGELLKENPAIVKTEKDGLKMLTMPVPLPIPVNLRPSVARSGDYLFIASSDALIQEALDVKAGAKPGLKSTAEFARLSHDIPMQGNQFSFLGEKFGKTMLDVQMQAMKMNSGGGNGSAGMVSIFQKLNGLMGPSASFNTSANGPEGWLTTGNGTQNPANIVLLPVVIIPAVVAGVMVPMVTRQAVTARHMESPTRPATRANKPDGDQ
jgi:hypothetical protein